MNAKLVVLTLNGFVFRFAKGAGINSQTARRVLRTIGS